jgi:predicted nucleotide-binding protein
MKKQRFYANTTFDSKTFSAGTSTVLSLSSKAPHYGGLDVSSGHDKWSFDSLDEFLAAANQGLPSMNMVTADGFGLHVYPVGQGTTCVVVTAPTREKIETVFAVFDKDKDRCRLPERVQEKPAAKIFIGHGRDSQWRDLKDHLHDKHGYNIEAYEIGSRAGHTIRDILEEMLEGSSFALLVMTGEDETKDGKLHARQNVVHEAGLFQGKLGFSRAIILLEDGTEEFSNIDGLQQIRFSKGKIKESFGDVLAVLKRELG